MSKPKTFGELMGKSQVAISAELCAAEERMKELDKKVEASDAEINSRCIHKKSRINDDGDTEYYCEILVKPYCKIGDCSFAKEAEETKEE